MPFIVNWPAKIAAGSVSNHQLAFYDVMPTLCEIIGVKNFAKRYASKEINDDYFDGLSFAPELTGKKQTSHEFLYWEFHETDQIAVRMGDWKLVVMAGEPHLYNLATDLHEDNDVAADYPEQVNEMIRIIYREHTDNPYFTVTLPKARN